jgi:hypothetical protein
MGCLADLVSFRDTCGGAASGAVDLSTLGMTEKELTDYMSADNASLSDFLSDRIAFSEKFLTSDVLRRYASRIIARNFAEVGRIGEPDENQELLTATAGTNGGIALEVSAPVSNVRIDVSRIEVYSDVGGTVNVLVYDLTDGTLVTTIPVVTTADQVTVKQVNLKLPVYRKKGRYFFTTSMPTYYKVWAHGGGCSTCGSSEYKMGNLRAWGARIANASAYAYHNLENVQHTSGLSITATVVCDHTAWLCEVKELVALPLAYKVAEESVNYGIGNVDVFNTRQGLNPEKLAERAAFFNAQYAAAMEKLYLNMPTPSDQTCFDCRRTVTNVISLP